MDNYLFKKPVYNLILIIISISMTLSSHIRNFQNGSNIHESNDRDLGYLVCAGNKHRFDLIRLQFTLRHVWKTHLPLYVAHCDELSLEFQKSLLESSINVNFINLCPSTLENDLIFGMQRKVAEKKLRGFFCKVAALLKSPLSETMLLDLDTVWFRNPEKLFYSKSYLLNKSLFFRDRLFNYEIHGGRIGPDEILDMYSLEQGGGYHSPINSSELLRLYHENGVNMYFANFVDSNYPRYNEHQDSSTVIIDKARHPKLIKRLGDWLQSFVLGFGDKEMFWVASTVVNEPFTWSPFLAGQYGDCMGLIIQYDPDDILLPDPSLAQPMYINAEYMVENVEVVGYKFMDTVTKAISSTYALQNVSLAQHMNSFNQPYNFKGCTCRNYDCVSLRRPIEKHFLLAQWITISVKLSKKGPSSDCVPIYVKHIDTLNKIFQEKWSLSRKECPIVGCPFLPMIPFNHSNSQMKICEPIVFSTSVDNLELQKLAYKARDHPFT